MLKILLNNNVKELDFLLDYYTMRYEVGLNIKGEEDKAVVLFFDERKRKKSYIL